MRFIIHFEFIHRSSRFKICEQFFKLENTKHDSHPYIWIEQVGPIAEFEKKSSYIQDWGHIIEEESIIEKKISEDIAEVVDETVDGFQDVKDWIQKAEEEGHIVW